MQIIQVAILMASPWNKFMLQRVAVVCRKVCVRTYFECECLNMDMESNRHNKQLKFMISVIMKQVSTAIANVYT